MINIAKLCRLVLFKLVGLFSLGPRVMITNNRTNNFLIDGACGLWQDPIHLSLYSDHIGPQL